MPNKSLRILIADAQHFNRLRIERLLNQLGYFRVAPVQSLEELLPLVEYGCEPLDLCSSMERWPVKGWTC